MWPAKTTKEMALVYSDFRRVQYIFHHWKESTAHSDAGYEGLHSDPKPNIFRQGSFIYIKQLKF